MFEKPDYSWRERERSLMDYVKRSLQRAGVKVYSDRRVGRVRVDLLGEHGDTRLAIECKGAPATPLDVARIREVQGVQDKWIVSEAGFNQPLVELALNQGVKVVLRDEVEKRIAEFVSKEGTRMANDEHLNIVLQGARAIAVWREKNPSVQFDLSGANLRRVDLVRANLNGAVARDANLEWADFRWADLIEADLSGANLSRADFHKADLVGARLARTNLADSNFEDANCRGVDLNSAVFSHTRLLNTDLGGSKGLTAAKHHGPSVIDSETLMKSGHLPSEFLRGCGLSEAAIKATYAGDVDALATTLGSEGEYYSCFLSYSSKDEAFAEKLLRDLQERGVRCWYAPKDMPIGARILDTIYGAIRQREKLLLILSERSVESEWVRDEVERAFAEERDRGDTIIFPVRLDEAVMCNDVAWAQKIRENRHIGDFRRWRETAAYRTAVERLLRDLTRQQAA